MGLHGGPLPHSRGGCYRRQVVQRRTCGGAGLPGRDYIVASALNDPIDAFRERGGDAAALCRRFGTDPEISPEARLSLQAFVGFSQAAAEMLHAPGFGWLAGVHFHLENIGAVGEAMRRAPTLGAALRLLRDAFALVQSDSLLALTVAEDEAVLTYRILDPDIWPRDQDAELTMAMLTNLVRQAAGRNWRPIELAFEHCPNGADGVRPDEPHCPVRYRAPANRLRLPVRLLDLPLPTGDAAAFRPLAQALTREAMQREVAAPIATRVRRQILRRLGREALDPEALGQTPIAAACGMSRRTLRRRLEAEGTCFHDLLAECRIRVARRLLADPQMGVAAVAEQLDYSDTTAFERAFRKREGITPAQFRRQCCRAQPVPDFRESGY